MDSNWCFQVHLPQILKGEDLLREKNNFETVDQSNPTPLPPPKTNGWNLKIIPFFKGDSSEPNLHDFGFKMLVFRAVNRVFLVYPIHLRQKKTSTLYWFSHRDPGCQPSTPAMITLGIYIMRTASINIPQKTPPRSPGNKK